MIPGFTDPALASIPPAGNLYFQADQAVASKSPGERRIDYIAGSPRAQIVDMPGGSGPNLMFGAGAMTASGEHIVKAANQTRGHWTEVLNFHGSPAPWVLIGILLVAGVLHLSAEGKMGLGKGRV